MSGPPNRTRIDPGALRICLVASRRFPIREPFAGGLEAQTYALTRELVRRGHQVTLFAAPGSTPGLGVAELEVPAFEASDAAQRDRNAPPAAWLAEHHAYLGLMLDLARTGAHRFDVVHNNSLHHLPVAMADALDVPVVTSLHTPPLPWLESAVSLTPRGSTFTAVSRHTARAWRHAVDATVVSNGVDVRQWRPGPGAGPAVWSGRLVREKAPHLAIDACRLAGVELDLVGPIGDPDYYREHVRPRLGGDVRHLGHLEHRALADVVGSASVALVTPEWDEPYGLVAAEAMACGTPVAAFDRGALGEVVSPASGVLAAAGDVAALAEAVDRARRLDRDEVRADAVRRCSLERMVDGYEAVYAAQLRAGVAA